MPRRIQREIKRRILVIENDLLLGGGVENLLLQEIGLDVIGISPRDEEELIRQIRSLQPNVVILDEATYLTNSVRLLAMLGHHHSLRLVIINANNDLVHVYHKYDVVLHQISDLIEVLLEK